MKTRVLIGMVLCLMLIPTATAGRYKTYEIDLYGERTNYFTLPCQPYDTDARVIMADYGEYYRVDEYTTRGIYEWNNDEYKWNKTWAYGVPDFVLESMSLELTIGKVYETKPVSDFTLSIKCKKRFNWWKII